MEEQKAEMTEDSLRTEQMNLRRNRVQKCAQEIDAVLAKHRCTILAEASPSFDTTGTLRVTTKIQVASKD